MSEVFDFVTGDSPLLVSIPHDGRELARGMAERMTAAGRALPDTDWHVRRLYGFAATLGASVIAANYSRYVVDLNRPADDTALYPGQVSTGLCPVETFAGEPIYVGDTPVSVEERKARVERYWRPYHDRLREALAQAVETFGYALLWDAHSIRTEVPTLFDGALPDLNIGTNDGLSCREDILAAVAAAAASSTFTSVSNGRFKGGYITRHYGDPENDIAAIQLELAQCNYMDEDSQAYEPQRAATLQTVIRNMLEAFANAAARAGSA